MILNISKIVLHDLYITVNDLQDNIQYGHV